AFGHGLSYTNFDYSDAKLASPTLAPGDTIKLSFTIGNTGEREGDEVPQVYFRHVASKLPQARQSLCGFARVHLSPGEAKPVAIDIPAARLRHWDEQRKDYSIEPGDYELQIGAASDDIRLR